MRLDVDCISPYAINNTLMALEDQDITRIMTSIRTVVQDEVKATVEPMEERLNQRFDDLTASNDRHLKQTQDWKQEQDLLRVGQKRVKDVLVRKGIASESELAV